MTLPRALEARALQARILIDARKARDLGIGRYVVGLVSGLQALDRYRLTVIAFPGDAELFPAGVTVVPSTAPHYSLRELVAVRAVIGRAKPDLFHAPHYVVPLAPPRRTVVTIHDLMHLHRPEHQGVAKRLYATTMMRRALRSARRIVAVSEATAREIAAFDADAADRTLVVHSGVDERFTGTIPAEDRARARRLVSNDGAPFVLFLGNDKPHKNLAGLLDAFARLGPLPHRLVLAGGDPRTADARRASVRAHGLDDRVVDLGRVADADVAPLLAEASVLVLPSFAEGFGLPVLEAQAVGTPVVCSDRGGLPEAAGDAAVFVSPDDVRTIEDGLRRVLGDDDLRRSLVAKGRARAATFTWSAVATRTAEVYDEVLAS